MAPPPPKLSSSSLADHFPNLLLFFQRSASQPLQHHHQNDASASSSSSTSGGGVLPSPPRRASAAPSFSSSCSTSLSPADPDADAHMRAFGSCTQVLATATTALFRAINTFGVYQPESAAADNTMTRRAKLLYVRLLDKAQRERGEWRGFADSSSPNRDSDATQKKGNESALGILTTHLRDLSRDDTFALLNELVDVSFRSIRGPLVSSEIYSKHKRPLAVLSLDIPVSLHALLQIRGILNQLGRDEKLCVFRLLTLWHAMAVANEAQDLRRTIQEKHHLVFSDCTELEFLTARRDPRHDSVAIALLHILVLYHDVLFSDVEFLLIKQELQLSQSLRRTRVEGEAEETNESKANVSSEDTAQSEATSTSSTSSPHGEQTESQHISGQTKGDDAADAAKELSQPMRRSSVEPETDETEESNPDLQNEVTAQTGTPPASSPSLCTERIADQTGDGDALEATTESPKPDEVNRTSNSVNPKHALAAVQHLETELILSEERPAAPDGEAETPIIAAATTETVAAELSSQQTPRELVDEPSQSAASVSPSPLTRSHSTDLPHHNTHASARGHGFVVSIRHHSLSPRKTRQSKRSQFESLTVSTATTITAATSEKEQKQHNNHHSSNSGSSSKSNDARQATLLSDVIHIADYFGTSTKEPVARKTSGNGSTNSESPTASAAIVRIQQHSPEAKESSSDSLTGRQRLGATGTAVTGHDEHRDEHSQAEAPGECKAGDCVSSQEPPVKRGSMSQSSKPSPRPHEITDLANTYFSFSFAAATMRTMAIMAVYAIRRHQHNHH